MNDEQKDFTLDAILRYEREYAHLGKKAQDAKFWVLGSIALASFAFGVRPELEESLDVARIALGAVGWLGVISALDNFGKMVLALGKKAGLENLAENLRYQFDNAKLETREKKGRAK